ncbi:MAG: flagellar biosynthetic protein FliO, partial [Nitrospinota bacterium]
IPSLGEAVVKVGSALAIVLALVLIVSFGARKYLNAMEGSLGSKKQLKVLSSHHIGVKKTVTIIELAGEILVLGVANESINLLARYTDEDKIEELRFAHRLPDRPNGMFKRLPFLSGIKKIKQKVNPAFAKKVASYVDSMKTETMKTSKESDTANDGTSKDEMVSSVAASIAAHLRAMNGATA